MNENDLINYLFTKILDFNLSKIEKMSVKYLKKVQKIKEKLSFIFKSQFYVIYAIV